MKGACISHTELPHTSRLFSDLLYHWDRVAGYYDLSPHSLESYRESAARVDFDGARRAALVAALRRTNGDSPSLDLLARPGTVAVVTGQQVGLYSGPSYTVYKALTAARLAESLTQKGIPAVPVFWLATEDHDFAEVNHCWVFDGNQRPVFLGLHGDGPVDVPVGLAPLDGLRIDELKAALAGLPYGDEVSTLVAETYLPGASMGDSFRALLQRLLPGFGLLYLDPLEPAIRDIAAPLLRDAVAAAPDMTADLLARNRALVDAGYHAQVHIEAHTSLFFLLKDGRRIHLRRQNGEYIARDQRYSPQELQDRAAQLSPSAVLRPVMQDYILPTVAYIGGPAELAYLAQAQVLYHRLLGRMPVALPRNGFTLLDARAAKLLDRYELTLPNFFHGEEPLKDAIARKLIPPDLEHSFRETRAGIESKLDELCGAVDCFDASLCASLKKSRAKMIYQLTKMQRKIERESIRRNQRALEEADYIYNLIYPHKHLQERLYSILPFLARHGLDLTARLYENVHLECADHAVLTI